MDYVSVFIKIELFMHELHDLIEILLFTRLFMQPLMQYLVHLVHPLVLP